MSAHDRAIRTGRIYARARGAATPAAGFIGLFALAAAGLLAGIAFFAWSINSNAYTVQNRYVRVQAHTRLVALAGRTTRLVRAIAHAASPLGPEVARIRRDTGYIKSQVGSIYDHSLAIRGLVYSIDSTANAIDVKVHAINATVHGIDQGVTRIHRGVVSIDGYAGSILSQAHSIAGTAGSIGTGAAAIVHDLGAILPVTRQIRAGVAGINVRLAQAIQLVRTIRRGLYTILLQVGRRTRSDPYGYYAPHGKSINGHANAIDCSPLIAGMHCGR